MLAYIGVGSNSGERLLNIQNARQGLEESSVTVTRMSPIYETEALNRPGQKLDPFLNAVFEIETDQSPEDLLKIMEKVERDMGRTSKGDWAPRTIDLDILFYGDQVIDSEDLKIPHPEIKNRWFALKPLSDLIPDFKHPLLLKSINQLLNELT